MHKALCIWLLGQVALLSKCKDIKFLFRWLRKSFFMFYRMTCSVYGALGVYYSDRKMAPSPSPSLLLCNRCFFFRRTCRSPVSPTASKIFHLKKEKCSMYACLYFVEFWFQKVTASVRFPKLLLLFLVFNWKCAVSANPTAHRHTLFCVAVVWHIKLAAALKGPCKLSVLKIQNTKEFFFVIVGSFLNYI